MLRLLFAVRIRLAPNQSGWRQQILMAYFKARLSSDLFDGCHKVLLRPTSSQRRLHPCYAVHYVYALARPDKLSVVLYVENLTMVLLRQKDCKHHSVGTTRTYVIYDVKNFLSRIRPRIN